MERMHPSSMTLKYSFLIAVACLLPATAMADISYTGTLASPESDFEATFTLTASGPATFQTWGFGGGTNAAGNPIPAGGFDPLIALFTGSGPSAAIYVDGFGNPLADADNLLNAPWSYVGNCPNAGTVAIGADNDCGDDKMTIALSAGTYTLFLSDANYIANAVYDNGTLSEGFTDLTAGVFQTCDPVANACITPSGNYAVDIVAADLATPEPSTAIPLGAILIVWAGWALSLNRRISPLTKGAKQ